MKKELVSVVFDRKKRVETTGEGKVEICIYLSRTERKFITITTCNAISWKKYEKSTELRDKVMAYKHIVYNMQKNGEEMTIARLDQHLGVVTTNKERAEKQKKISAPNGFINFMRETIAKEELAPATLQRKRVTIDAMIRYGKLSSFSDVTEKNIKGFDDFLRAECHRTLPTLHNYHKILKMYTRLAAHMDYIVADPYDSPLCKFERGNYKERRPLNGEELLLLRSLNLSPKESRVRDLFIFCAYTGLAFVDSQVFDFFTMTENVNGQAYIDGKRVKTGCTFYTPILPPAMDVLKKYNYHLPHISNQKANDYLHLLEMRSGLNKPLTTHCGSHSKIYNPIKINLLGSLQLVTANG
ncbi:MAG: phage integrase SAM-like domain-containing protein [Bacteroidaceae bacterium]|nr:phage integrase SAM-like domain-containing protein [Bacteroidaceae bacterium]